jgi:hypothetical protein
MSGVPDTTLRVLVCGGGALAHAFAGVIGALPDARVMVLCRRPVEWSDTILVHHADLVVVGRAEVTHDPVVAAQAALILVAAPAYAHAPILHRLVPYIQSNSWIAALPAIGGFDLLIGDLMPRHVKLLGSLRAPYNARVIRYGHEVLVTGVVPRLDIVVGRGADEGEALGLVDQAFGLPVRVVKPFLLATLSPAGTIFHAARLFELLTEPKPIRQNFYANWGVTAGHAYLAMDNELTALRRALRCDVSGIEAASHYGVSDPAALAARVRSLRGLPEVEAPIRDGMLEAEHRFVREDVPYGLCLVRHLADGLRLPCPVVTKVLETIAVAAGPAASSLTRLPSHIASRRLEDWIEAV